MKRFLLLLLTLCAFAQLSAQKLTVVEFEPRDRDLKAKQKPRFDNNGDPCALVRVQIAAPNCKFTDSYIVGDVEQGFGEYLVYMAKGARRLRISHPEFLFTPLDYEFPTALNSYRTYALILEVPIYTHYSEIVEQKERNSEEEAIVSVSEMKWHVGDYYNEDGKEGVVFLVDATGEHGKIISMKEAPTYLQWTSDKVERRRLIGADDQKDGAKNMEVVMQIPDWKRKYPAFAWCAGLGEGWYLPAIEELKIMLLNRAMRQALNRTLEQHGGDLLPELGDRNWYWSSSELDKENGGTYCVYDIHMNDGRVYEYNKNHYSCARALYAF